jgi:hypothetical protein
LKIVIGHSLLLESGSCPVCKMVLDEISPVNTEGIPEPGSYTVCMYCGSILRFGLGMRLEEISKDELREMAKDSELFELLTVLVKAAKELILDRQRKKARHN